MRSISTLTFLCAAAALSGQTVSVIDGTSGSMTSNSNYSTDSHASGLVLRLGFYVDYLVVGGGGGGGAAYDAGPGGGGGAGGFLSGSLLVTPASLAVAVGAGGGGGTNGGAGTNGGNSTFGDVTALGGGGGGASRGNGLNGASGGGAGGRPLGANRIGGSGQSGQGNDGGDNFGNTSGNAKGGGGGGGASSAGSTSNTQTGAAGGAGLNSNINGTNLEYSRGGSGGNSNNSGNGSNATLIGSGGGGASSSGDNVDRNGGSGTGGRVIVRYAGSSAGTGGSVSSVTVPGYTVHSFSSTGNFSLNLTSLDLSTRLGATHTGVISGSGVFTYDGPGRLTLDAANTYTGATTVSAGTLALGAAGSIANSSGISLASGSTLDVSAKSGFTLGSAQTLTGGGTVVGDTTIAGTHTPGFSPGLQTFEDNLTYSNGSTIVWELGANSTANRGTDFDAIDVQGDLTFQGTVDLSLVFNYGGGAVDWSSPFWSGEALGEQGWKIFGVTGTINGFSNLQIANSAWLDSSAVALADAHPNASFSLYQGTDGVYLNYTPVPEPSTYGLILGGLTLAGAAIRRRKLKN